MQTKCIYWTFIGNTMFLQTRTFFDKLSETNTFFKILIFWVQRALLACLAVWAVMKQGNRKEFGEKESFAPKFPQGSLLHDVLQHKFIYWGIVACTHPELIEWFNALSNLSHGLGLWVNWAIPFVWTQWHQKQTRKFPQQTRKFAEQTRKFTEWSPMWFLVLNRAAWGHLLALTCCVYTIPPGFYISHASLDLGCLALLPQIWWQFESNP